MKKTDIMRLIADWKAEGASFAEIAARLNEQGHRTEDGKQFTKDGVKGRYARHSKKLSQPPQLGEQVGSIEPVVSSQVTPSGEPIKPQETQPSPQEASAPVAIDESCDTDEHYFITSTQQTPDSQPSEKQSSPDTCEICESLTDQNQEVLPVEKAQPTSPEIPEEWLATLREMIQSEVRILITNVEILTKDEIPPAIPRIKGSKELSGERKTLPGTRVDAILFNLFEGSRKELGISASECMQRILWNHFKRPRLSFEVSQPSANLTLAAETDEIATSNVETPEQ